MTKREFSFGLLTLFEEHKRDGSVCALDQFFELY